MSSLSESRSGSRAVSMGSARRGLASEDRPQFQDSVVLDAEKRRSARGRIEVSEEDWRAPDDDRSRDLTVGRSSRGDRMLRPLRVSSSLATGRDRLAQCQNDAIMIGSVRTNEPCCRRRRVLDAAFTELAVATVVVAFHGRHIRNVDADCLPIELERAVNSVVGPSAAFVPIPANCSTTRSPTKGSVLSTSR
jgi:hypothetical protein